MGRAHVLVAEDNEMFRDMIATALRGAGHSVVTAVDGMTALQALEEESFDAAVIDHFMPPPSGLEVLREARLSQPSCRRILMSGRLTVPLLVNAINQGDVHRVLPVPFEESDLLDLLERCLLEAENLERMRREERPAQLGQTWRRALVECLRDGHLRLAIQPVVNAREDRILGYEALLRSSHPMFPLPTAVLEAALVLDMLSDVGAVISTLAVAWLQNLPAGLNLFMNLPAEELSSPVQLAHRIECLRPFHARMVFEIAQQSNLRDQPAWDHVVGVLRQAGFRIAIDDMGCLYSSLSLLASLQPEFMKVNMQLIRNVDRKPHQQRMVRLLASFAKSAGATLVAMGVETQAEVEALLDCGIELFQGFFYGRPRFSPAGPVPKSR